MVRRRYMQLDRLAKRLARRLNRLVIYVRAHGASEAAKGYALMQAHAILDEYFTQLIAYTFKSHVKRDLHKRKGLKELGYGDVQVLRNEVNRKLADFRKILNDV